MDKKIPHQHAFYQMFCFRFHFTDQAKSSTQEGEASVIQMVVSLSEALENQYGRLCTRLYRAFRPKPIRATADWR